jgi:hypothetical protein
VQMLEQLIGELTAQVRLLTTMLQRQNGGTGSTASAGPTMNWAERASQEE